MLVYKFVSDVVGKDVFLVLCLGLYVTTAINNAVAPKLDTTTFEEYAADRDMTDAEIQAYADKAAEDAQAAAEATAKKYTDDELAEAVAALQAEIDKKADGETGDFDAAGSADKALADAKAYTDTEMAKIQALTEAEIDQAIAAATQA